MKKALALVLMAIAAASFCLYDAGGDGEFRNWKTLMKFPSKEEISNYNKTSTSRAPYLVGWFNTGRLGNYTQISVDVKADYLPLGTYCSVANFYLDYSSVEKKYGKADTGTIYGYAGLQRTYEGRVNNGILSFWDVFFKDDAGKETLIRAKQTYPVPDPKDATFDHEGTGVHCLRDYPWEARKWYRVLLQCGESSTTGNTTMEQWVCDLSTMNWTKLCEFDLGAPDVSFKGNFAVFLENFHVPASGEIRTMEVRNIRVLSKNTGEWVGVESGSFCESKGWPGSYRYGSDGHTFWMISTGVPNCAPAGKTERFDVKNTEFGRPF